MKAKLLIATALTSSVLLSGCMTESMGEAIFMHLAIPTDVDSVQHKVTLNQNEQKIFDTLLAAKDAKIIRDSRKSDVKEYFAKNQKNEVMDTYDYVDLSFYLATAKAINKSPKTVSAPCLAGDATKCDTTANDYQELANLTGKEWKKLLLDGGIKLDEKHQKLLDNIGKENK